MYVHVDQNQCETAGICVQLCPDIFRFEPGSKKAVARFDRIPADLELRCREAVRRCPAGAIRLTE